VSERKPVTLYELLAPPIPKSKAEIRITRDRGKRWRYNLRVWVADKLTGEWRPTTRGLTFDEDKLQALRDSLILACQRVGLGD